jgi:hypothetical protein
MKNKWAELIFQIIPVMIGVYLGFLVSDWSSDRQLQAQLDKLVNNVLVEIANNQDAIEQTRGYHQMLRDSSMHYANPETAIKKPDFYQGTRVLKLSVSAYQTGIQTGIINELNIDQIQGMNQLYTHIAEYNQYANTMMASLIEKDFTNDPEDIRKIARFLSVTLSDVVSMEEHLSRELEKVSELLKK